MVMKMRSVFILLLIVAYAGPYLSQGYVYTSRYGAVLNAWGTFACAMSNAKILLVCFVGYILLISDVPYFSEPTSMRLCVPNGGRSCPCASLRC